MDETNATAQEVRNMLKTMESVNKAENEKHPGSSEARIRQNMQVTLAKKFMDLMSECVAGGAASIGGSCVLSVTRCAGTRRCRRRRKPSTGSAWSGSSRL